MLLSPPAFIPPRNQIYTSVSIFLLGAIALVVGSGYSVGAPLLLLGGLYSCLNGPKLALTRTDCWIIGVLLAFGLLNILDALLYQEGMRELDKPLRFLLAGFILVLIRKYPPKLSWLWAGLGVGGILTAFWAGYQSFVLGIDRAGGYTHLIQFGNIAMLTGFFCLAGLGWACAKRQRRAWVVFLLLGAIGGMLGSLLSGTRGGWVGLPIMLFVLYRAYGSFFSARAVAVALALVAGGAVTVYNVPQLEVQQRVDAAISDIQRYRAGDSTGSLGARFEMWKGAAQLFMAKPILGWGSSNYQPAMQVLVDQGKAHEIAARFGHPHNDILNVAAKQGLVGLLALLALYLVPIRLFARGLSSPNLAQRSLATAGTLLPIAYIDFGLSQTFFSHNSGVMIYSVWLVVLWGCYRNACAPLNGRVETAAT